MLLGQLTCILSGVVIQPAAHEVAVLTAIFASPPELNFLIDLLNIGQIEVRLGCLEIAKPLLQLPHILLQKCSQLLIIWVLLNHVANRKHEGRRVSLQRVLVDERYVRHHG